MKNIIKTIKARHAEKQRKNHLSYLKQLFQVEAKNDTLWLTCDGVAVARFDNDTDVNTITERLNEAIRCSQDFYSDPFAAMNT